MLLAIRHLENLDTDILPPSIAIEITKQGVGLDENNSYLPFLGQDELRKATARMAGVAAGLNAEDDGLADAVKIWQERRDILLSEFQGLPVVPPHGGWSMLMNAHTLGMTAPELSQKFFSQAKIAATPMIGWGPQAEQYVRFVFSNEPKARLRGIGERVKKAIL